MDSEIGLSVIDRFSHKLIEFLKHSTNESNLNEFIESINSDLDFLASTPVFRGDLFPRPANLIKIFDFFANTPRLIERDISKFKSTSTSDEDQSIKSKFKYNYGPSSIFNNNTNNSNNNRRVYRISFNNESHSNSTNRQLNIIYTVMCIALFYYLLKPSRTLKE